MATVQISNDIALLGHLIRRAAFGASASRLESLQTMSYEQVVDELINVQKYPRLEEDLLERYHIQHADEENTRWSAARWMYRMINSERPLEEKTALMWHGVFATGYAKVTNNPMMRTHYEMLRNQGLGSFRDLLVALSRDPAMIYWLDQQMNHSEARNENFGRELLELFSMGIGNYTEDDVKDCARAFTGWTKSQTIPRYPTGFYNSEFIYRSEDHDDGVKTFLGETGRFNGEDIIDIIVRQPATARFVAKEIYAFFVSDDGDESAIEEIAQVYFDSNYVISDMLQYVFNQNFFKDALFKKVKSPPELVAGTAIIAGRYRTPYEYGLTDMSKKTTSMGQELLNPPTVEGWHAGREWIDSSYLVERINFASEMIGNMEAPGVYEMVERITDGLKEISPDELLDACLYEMGSLILKDNSRAIIFEELNLDNNIQCDSDEFREATAQILRLIVSSREYQFC